MLKQFKHLPTMQLRNNWPLGRNYRPHLIVLSVFHRPTDQLSFWIQSALKSSGHSRLKSRGHSAISFQQLQPQSIVAEKFEAVDDGGHHSDIVVVVVYVVYVGIVGWDGRVFTRHFTQKILLTFTVHLGTSSVRIFYRLRLWRRLAFYAPFYATNSSYVYGTFGNFFGKDILRGRT